jgi:hypothetical protein
MLENLSKSEICRFSARDGRDLRDRRDLRDLRDWRDWREGRRQKAEESSKLDARSLKGGETEENDEF